MSTGTRKTGTKLRRTQRHHLSRLGTVQRSRTSLLTPAKSARSSVRTPAERPKRLSASSKSTNPTLPTTNVHPAKFQPIQQRPKKVPSRIRTPRHLRLLMGRKVKTVPIRTSDCGGRHYHCSLRNLSLNLHNARNCKGGYPSPAYQRNGNVQSPTSLAPNFHLPS